jgi:hypothetical protein
MPSESNIEAEVGSAVLGYLKATPQAIAVLFVAFLQGHLWIFTISAYLRKGTKGDPLLKTIVGRTILGLLWMTLSLVLVYAFQFHSWPTENEKIVSLAIPTIVLSLVLQLVAFVLFVVFGEKR